MRYFIDDNKMQIKQRCRKINTIKIRINTSKNDFLAHYSAHTTQNTVYETYKTLCTTCEVII